MDKAIKLAESVGYSQSIDPLNDYLFWVKLGEAKGWTGEYRYREGHDPIPMWQYKHHLFTTHIDEGKDIESFFRNA